MHDKPPLGYHYLWDIHNCQEQTILKVDNVTMLLDEICTTYSLTVLKKSSNQFAPHGATAIYLLAESHLSIHTWPENNYVALDLFSCVPLKTVEELESLFRKHLGNGIKIKEQYIERR